jgi:hypothetical protein
MEKQVFGMDVLNSISIRDFIPQHLAIEKSALPLSERTRAGAANVDAFASQRRRRRQRW